MTLYEFPLDERIRTLLRLEYLFNELFKFIDDTHENSIHFALDSLFDIMDICDRGDIRSGILQDIDKQKQHLESYRHFKDVDTAVLDRSIEQLTKTSDKLIQSGRIGSELKQNQWLMNLKSRFVIAGGVTPMDIPSYLAWKQRKREIVIQDVKSWVAPFLPLFDCIQLLLDMLRNAGDQYSYTTDEQGKYNIDTKRTAYQLARIWIPKNFPCTFPEISANQYIACIRFSKLSTDYEIVDCHQNIPFKIALCRI
ncbi:MAG: cell division protein ZapD [Alcaligenaceae bacterium]|nr:cell division protein ZapD [Alcaligenaceae bacterium]